MCENVPYMSNKKRQKLNIYTYVCSYYIHFVHPKVSHLEKNEVVYVVGNLPELGAWNHNQAILMSQEHSSQRESPVGFDNSNSSGEFYTEDGQDNTADSIFDDEKEEWVTHEIERSTFTAFWYQHTSMEHCFVKLTSLNAFQGWTRILAKGRPSCRCWYRVSIFHSCHLPIKRR